MSKITVIAAVVDTVRLTLYQPDGSTLEIPQGDPRVREIIDVVLPALNAGRRSVEVDLDLVQTNPYSQFERKGSGLVKLFRVAKNALFGKKDEPVAQTGTYGELPDQTMAAVADIMTHAKPMTDETLGSDETVVALVGNTVVPGMENLKDQFAYSAKTNSTANVEKLIERLAGMIEKRRHSVEDLLRFVQRGDLPIAEDGCIIAYKLLFAREGGRYVDPHTRRVSQTVGSYVCVDESLVDLARDRECSSGLHIGRRAYMGSFSGDTMFMCKVAPEDVMVVPHGDPNKVRVKGYHIVAKLNDKAHSLVRDNQPATSDEETARLLSDVIAGNHIRRTEEVRITGQRGEGVVISVLDEQERKIAPKPEPVKSHRALDDKEITSPVSPTEISKELVKAKPAVAPASARVDTPDVVGPPIQGLRQKLAAQLVSQMGSSFPVDVRIKAAETLLTQRKTKWKVSWEKLAQPDLTDQYLQSFILNLKNQASENVSPLGFKPGDILTNESGKGEVIRPEPAAPQINRKANKRQTEARTHFDNAHWQHLIALKKRAKVSWSALGFDQSEIDEIKRHLED